MSDKSQRIQHILEDDIFVEVVKEFKDNQLNGIENTLPQDVESREIFYRRINAVNDFMGYLESIAMDSKIKDNNHKEL